MEAWKVNTAFLESSILYLELAFIVPVIRFSIIQGYLCVP